MEIALISETDRDSSNGNETEHTFNGALKTANTRHFTRMNLASRIKTSFSNISAFQKVLIAVAILLTITAISVGVFGNKSESLGTMDNLIEQPNDCTPTLCLNGGACIVEGSKRQCKCLAAFTGNNCEVKNECVYADTCTTAKTSESSVCECRGGNTKDPHYNKICTLENQNASLIFGNSNGIYQFSLSQQTVTQIQEHIPMERALDLLYRTNTMFWSDLNGMIYMAPIRQGATKKVILNDPGSSILALAVDWVYHHLYYSDSNRDIISVANLDSTMKKVLFTTRVPHTSAIVVDPINGWIYWADWDTTRIERSGMDGSQIEVINLCYKHPYGLTLDMTQNRLYWTIWSSPSSINSMKPDGTNLQRVFRATPPLFHESQFWSITTLGENVYWREYYTNAVYKTDKCGGGEATLIHTDTTGHDNSWLAIHAYHVSKQPEGVNYCAHRNGGQCSHLCFPTPSTGNQSSQSFVTKCACPDGLRLSFNQKTCT